MRIVFIGQSSAYSAIALRQIADKYPIVLIAEAAPKPAPGRGLKKLAPIAAALSRKYGPSSLQRAARKLNCPYLLVHKGETQRLEQEIQSLKPDLGCVASMSFLLPESIVKAPPHGFLNLHPTLLPRYRGPNPWFWQYYFKEESGGVTVHLLDRGEDTGDIVRQSPFPIPLGTTERQLVELAATLGGKLLAEAIGEIAQGTTRRQPQAHLSCPRRARNLKPGEKVAPWLSWSLEHAYHFLRGTYVWYDSGLHLNGFHRFLLWEPIRISSTPHQRPVGRLHHSDQGCFIGHPQGRIYVRPCFSPKAVLQKALRLLAR